MPIKIVYKKKIQRSKKVKLNLDFLWLKKITLKNSQIFSLSKSIMITKLIKEILKKIKIFWALVDF